MKKRRKSLSNLFDEFDEKSRKEFENNLRQKIVFLSCFFELKKISSNRSPEIQENEDFLYQSWNVFSGLDGDDKIAEIIAKPPENHHITFFCEDKKYFHKTAGKDFAALKETLNLMKKLQDAEKHLEENNLNFSNKQRSFEEGDIGSELSIKEYPPATNAVEAAISEVLVAQKKDCCNIL